MYGSGCVSLLIRIMPVEYEPTRMPSSCSKREQVSTHTRSPGPRCVSPTISISSSCRSSTVSLQIDTSCVACPTCVGVSSTPSGPRCSTFSVTSASSRSATTVISSPAARSAAASRISSGILLGSCRNSTSSHGVDTDSSHARVSVASPVTSMNTPSSTPSGTAKSTGSPSFTRTICTCSSSAASAGCRSTTATLHALGGSRPACSASFTTNADTPTCSASSVISSASSPMLRRSIQESFFKANLLRRG